MSDTCSRNEKGDTAGPRLQLEIKKNFPQSKFFKKIVPDEINNIKDTLELWIKYGCNVIFTVGELSEGSENFQNKFTKSLQK